MSLTLSANITPPDSLTLHLHFPSDLLLYPDVAGSSFLQTTNIGRLNGVN